MRIYVSGPMSGVPVKDYTKAFADAAKKLRKAGHKVVNPAELDKKTPKLSTWSEFMRRDIKILMDCDGIHMLDGWEHSEGARLELHTARAVGIDRVDADGGWLNLPGAELLPRRESILVEAGKLVNGPRQDSYGRPIKDFTRTGRLWGPLLGLDRDVTPMEVALCMAAVKLSREINKHKRDNLVDLSGYAATAQMVAEDSGLD